MPHVHIGIVEFAITGLNVIIFTFLWRALSAQLVKSDSDSSQAIGRAMAGVYS